MAAVNVTLLILESSTSVVDNVNASETLRQRTEDVITKLNSDVWYHLQLAHTSQLETFIKNYQHKLLLKHTNFNNAVICKSVLQPIVEMAM